MSLKVSFVYPWATFGGVERVLLNRAMALRNVDSTVHIDLCFLHDAGGLSGLKAALTALDLDAHCSVSSSIDGSADLIFVIDAPEAIAECNRRGLRFVVECHTAYTANREYLRDVPSSCQAIIVPSESFRERVLAEFKGLSQVKVLPNFVPWDTPMKRRESVTFPEWGKVPILFLARLDRLKNPLELLDAFSILELQQPAGFIPVFVGPRSSEIDFLSEIDRRSLGGKVLYLPPVPFLSVGSLMEGVRSRNGIFVSCSEGESFGLSAAEAICAGIPPVLSRIDAHCNLVREHDEKFIYELGSPNELAKKIACVSSAYEQATAHAEALRSYYSSARFLEAWDNLIQEVGL